MKKHLGVIFIVGILFTVLVFTMFGKQGLLSLFENHMQMKHMSEQIIQSNKTIDSLQTEVNRLRHDSSYIEKIAREKLGMARKNEKVYKFVDE